MAKFYRDTEPVAAITDGDRYGNEHRSNPTTQRALATPRRWGHVPVHGDDTPSGRGSLVEPRALTDLADLADQPRRFPAAERSMTDRGQRPTGAAWSEQPAGGRPAPLVGAGRPLPSVGCRQVQSGCGERRERQGGGAGDEAAACGHREREAEVTALAADLVLRLAVLRCRWWRAGRPRSRPRRRRPPMRPPTATSQTDTPPQWSTVWEPPPRGAGLLLQAVGSRVGHLRAVTADELRRQVGSRC